MSVIKPIRTRFEQLLTGDYSINPTYSITSGRFHVLPSHIPDVLKAPEQTKERVCNIFVSAPRPLLPLNMCDTLHLYTAKMTVDIAYVLTNRGNDETEDETDTGGERTSDAVNARMGTDAVDIIRAFSWQDNFAGIDPTVCNCSIGQNSIVEQINDKDARLSITFDLLIEISTTTVYAAEQN